MSQRSEIEIYQPPSLPLERRRSVPRTSADRASEDQNVDLRLYWQILKRRRRTVFVVWLTIVLGVLVVAVIQMSLSGSWKKEG